MGQMVTSIAHEIKNPLGSIKGAVQILRDKETPERDRAEFAVIIEKEVDRLDKVVRDYLTYAKPAQPKIAEIDLCRVIGDVIRQAKIECRDRDIEIAFTSSELPRIMGDSDRLHQLFLNILLNGIQAVPQGGKIDIACGVVERGSRPWLESRISDTGPGIPSENLDKIFEPFFSTKTQGTGLGLATARAIVTEHKGTITAESVDGRGTTFVIAFPLDKGGMAV